MQQTVNTIKDTRRIQVPRFERDGGTLSVVEEPVVPFPIARVFAISAPANSQRGYHAHRECSQFLYCQNGAIQVTVRDESSNKIFRLEGSSDALLAPPGLWLELDWQTDNAELIVLCDLPFSEADYIRDWDSFLEWRKNKLENIK